MQPSLLNIRKRLTSPLTWFLVLAVLVPASPHVAQGLVLCVGKSHVDVEAASARHHDGRSSLDTDSTRSLADSEHPAPAFHVVGASEQSPASCLDLPLPTTADICRQATRSEALDVGTLSLDQSVVAAPPASPRPHPQSATPVSFSPRALSTVVLLI